MPVVSSLFFFFFDLSATSVFYTLSLHDALPISFCFDSPTRRISPTLRWRIDSGVSSPPAASIKRLKIVVAAFVLRDRKSTRLNSSHTVISYAVFCLKKKKKRQNRNIVTQPNTTT